ncbi:peroxide stress protein YaaA [Actinomyces sp. 2119]|uniref:YaaA family protein n=1 Tax=Actinomyces sp. 2119 TaxID=2321393 RepID=UPI000E6C0AC6|nr:peroxide stress protein YaaA [Actinomyces sp. 2119]RJF44671.1 peroxide stress protein YaaA [Actinomyces sp. 2119]
MLILLPPSEGKTAPREGPALRLSTLLEAQELTGSRVQVMDTLARASARKDAAAVLGLGPRTLGEVQTNLRLETAACAPAYDLFTGVLYEAADLRGLGSQEGTHAVMDRHLIIISGLWGILRPTDRIPDHRLPIGSALPGLGRMAAYWRPRLQPVLETTAAGRVVVDCRSTAYASVWQPARSLLASAHSHLVRVAVVRTGPGGARQVFSHGAKRARGQLVGTLLRALSSGALNPQSSTSAVAEAAASMDVVRDVELSEPDRQGRQSLTLVTRH